MRKIYCALLAMLLMCGVARASDPIGIYALIDKVVMEPSDSQPDRVQIWGAFSVAMPRNGYQYSVPVRGYLYYSLDGQKDAAARFQSAQELWEALDKVRLQFGMEAHGLHPGRARAP